MLERADEHLDIQVSSNHSFSFFSHRTEVTSINYFGENYVVFSGNCFWRDPQRNTKLWITHTLWSVFQAARGSGEQGERSHLARKKESSCDDAIFD